MKKTTAVVASCVALMSCGSGESTGISSFVSSPDRFANSGEVAAIPTETQRYNETAGGDAFAGQNEVTSITYDSATETLTILGDPFDLAGTFKRAPKRDVRGFAAFENEGGARNYLALVRVDSDNNLAAGVVGTPFRLDNEFGGTVLARGAAPTLPTNREVRHVGDYAGVRNVGTNNGDDMSNSFLHRVEGRVQLDLDFFTDRQSAGIEGVITNRRNMDGTTTREVEVEVPVIGRPGQTTTETRQIAEEITYQDIVLQFTGIDENGNFSGIAAVGGQPVGLYDGMIAGNNAAASAGIVVIQEGSPVSLERGAFIARATD
ncbi:hypothetical protein LY56_01277 [Roseinatronobacter thiooxidans]|uniref:Transferrin-binding protein B C-lobe/N-lobe beta barrel domain-containing protein n=2 Tax=Roseinatronobacter thiooxidans TaxID=121821 RepID=A0A2W7QCG2_9RHOB|nr:hypothetical protein LY56_01277 [Roseinatronobacter thiooxidans]